MAPGVRHSLDTIVKAVYAFPAGMIQPVNWPCKNNLILQAQKGHRFVTPLHRGSQRPIQEPVVILETFRKPYQKYKWIFFPFNEATMDPILEGIPSSQLASDAIQADTKDDASSVSSSSPSSTASSSVAEELDFGDTEELIGARITKIRHMMLATTNCHQPRWNDQHFKAACGARLPRDNCFFDPQRNPIFGMCSHAACFKRWQQASCVGD